MQGLRDGASAPSRCRPRRMRRRRARCPLVHPHLRSSRAASAAASLLMLAALLEPPPVEWLLLVAELVSLMVRVAVAPARGRAASAAQRSKAAAETGARGGASPLL